MRKIHLKNSLKLYSKEIPILFGFLIFGICFPKIIDYLFSIQGSNITSLRTINASDLLTFWASLLVLTSTVILTLVTLKQNDRLMKLEMAKSQPLIIIDGSDFDAKRFQKLELNRTIIGKLKYHYDDPNMEFSFWVKNISEIYISKITIVDISIVGIHMKPDRTPITIFESENPVDCAIENALAPSAKIRMLLCFKNQYPLSHFDIYAFSLTCELINPISGTQSFQRMNFQVAQDGASLYIIGNGTYNLDSFQDK